MKFPSEYLEDLVPVVDRIEDEFLDRYAAARTWASGWKVWEWRAQAERIETLKARNRELVEAFKDLREKYREETGKVPPGAITLVLADDEGVSEFTRTLARSLENLLTRMRR